MKLKDGSVIAAFVLVVALVTACGLADTPATLVPVRPTATPLPPTSTLIPPTATHIPPTDAPEPTSCEEVEGICMELTFDGESCHYEGPTSLKTEPVTLIFFNESDGAAATNMIRLLEDKTFQDVVDYSGEEPSTKHHPSWSVEIPGVWKNVGSGKSHVWKGVLKPGIHALVCARIAPLGVWMGAGFTVDE